MLENEKRALVSITLILALLILPVSATATTISIADAFVEPGEDVVTALMITNVSNVGVANIHIAYNSSIVHVTAVNNSEFSLYTVINNSIGVAKIGGVDYDDGLSGDVKLADLTLNAVGNAYETSSLTISIKELKEAGATEISIPATVANGTVVLNLPPVAVARSLHRINNVGAASKAIFNGTASYDLSSNGYIVNYDWDFGDGHASAGKEVEHSYATWNWKGTSYEPFNVSLTVNDDGGLAGTAIIPVDVHITGDANGDGEVNIIDAVWVGRHWRAACNESVLCCNYLWDDEQADGADMNNDCEINILDAVIIGTNWRGTAW